MVQINLFPRQEQRHRCREKTCGNSGGTGEWDKSGDWDWHTYTAAAAKLLQSCPILCNPIDGSPPGSSVPGILQARTLEWVAISFSNAWKWKVKSEVAQLCPPWPHGLQPTTLLHPWDFPGKSTGVGCHCLLQVLHTEVPETKGTWKNRKWLSLSVGAMESFTNEVHPSWNLKTWVKN